MKKSSGEIARRPLLIVIAAAGLGLFLAGWAGRFAFCSEAAFSSSRIHPAAASGSGGAPFEYGPSTPFCEQNEWLCTDSVVDQNGEYIGHDEPALLFYSNIPGSGNSTTYTITLPKDPPTLPAQDGRGGTFNFQLHPAFWFGMAMCDTQSAPEFTNTCTPDSDRNIFDNSNPGASDYIGFHPGTAFMEMQFYPPRWATLACDATHWCAALNIDSLSVDQNKGIANNRDCLNRAGQEPVNFAYVTKSGVADSAANPLNPNRLTPNPSTDLLFNSGDTLMVTIDDTSNGVKVTIHDFNTGQSGSMTASTANGFAHVLYQPSAATCSTQPYAFHPMYATSSEHTQVPWSAHSYNVSFADEIGHFEYCNAIDFFGNCTAAGGRDPVLDSDDTQCFSTSSPLVQLTGCTATESDFDGVPYQRVWPGTNHNASQDALFHPTPVLFTSPLFPGPTGDQNYDRMAFEADLPAIEKSQGCSTRTGAGCSNPPSMANFYPLFTTRASNGECAWQLGGADIPGSTNKFGGSSRTEFGPLSQLVYPAPGGPGFAFNNHRQILTSNPCPALTGPQIALVPPAVKVGSTFTLKGSGFTNGSVVNFFVSTATGAMNAGPFSPSAITPTELTVAVPATVTQGEGFVNLQVVNKDQVFAASKLKGTLLQGFAPAGLPTITGVNGRGLDPTSIDPAFAVNNVNTLLALGVPQTINGVGFDTAHGVGVDLFCACPGGKVGPFFLNSGNPGLRSTAISLTIPNSGKGTPVVGPGSLRVDNNGGDGSYRKQSNAVAVQIGARISLSGVSLSGSLVTVDGAGFSPLTVINFFNAQGGRVVNLGGLSDGKPVIDLKFNGSNQFTFTLPARAMAGAAYVEAINPPFLPYTNTGTSPNGDLTIP